MAKRELFAGNFERAHAAAQQVLRGNPREYDAVLVMAAIALEFENVPGARKLCDLAGSAGVESGWLAVLQARLALLEQDQDNARALARKAASLGTDDAHVANQLGVVLSRTGAHADAVTPFRQAVAAVPESADYRHNLAIALQFAGDLAQAEEHFRQLVALHPAHAKGWLALVQLTREPDRDWAEQLAAHFGAARGAVDRLHFGHALARLAELRGDWDESFDWLTRAKEARRGEVAHDRDATEKLVAAAIASASGAGIAATPAGDERPLFIVGMPRSGTTLVERILTSHSQVTSVGELSDFAIVLKRALATSGPLVLDAEVLRGAAQSGDLLPVGEEYLRRASVLAGSAGRFIDKMPFNSFYAPAILRALPGARIICLRRSPHDVLFANYRQLFATGFSYYSYGYDFSDTAHFVAGFERMADTFEAALPPGRFHAVRYEDIVADQRGETERLLEFCGLDWEDACMQFHRNAEPVATASSVQVRSPIYSSSIGQWQRYGESGRQAVEELRRYGIEPVTTD